MNKYKDTLCPPLGRKSILINFKFTYIIILKILWVIFRIQNGSDLEGQIAKEIEVGEKTEHFFYQIFKRV